MYDSDLCYINTTVRKYVAYICNTYSENFLPEMGVDESVAEKYVSLSQIAGRNVSIARIWRQK